MMTLPKTLIYISYVVATLFTTNPIGVAPQKAKQIVLTEQDNQKEIKVKQGQSFTLKLSENA